MATEQPASSEFLIFTLHRNYCTSPTWTIFPAQKNLNIFFSFQKAVSLGNCNKSRREACNFCEQGNENVKNYAASQLPTQPAVRSLVVLTITPCISFYRKKTFPDAGPTTTCMQTKSCSFWKVQYLAQSLPLDFPIAFVLASHHVSPAGWKTSGVTVSLHEMVTECPTGTLPTLTSSLMLLTSAIR